jgi:hypothetical protein
MMKNYIQQNQKKNKDFTISNIEVLIKDLPPSNISVENVVNRMLQLVPRKLLTNVKYIKVGQFQNLEKREIQAMYKDSTLYLTNAQIDEADMLDDMVHEVAHSVEEIFNSQIYGDKKIQNEFVSKREKLWTRLKDKEFHYPLDSFLDINFDRELDVFLHKKVGYDLLSMMTYDLFFSSYGSVSIREYFANGFEAFFLREETYRLKKISPYLYQKLKELV